MAAITVNKIWLTETAIWIQTTDGRVAHENFADYQRLRYATPAQREHFTFDQFGIHWEDLDEDLSFEGFLLPLIYCANRLCDSPKRRAIAEAFNSG